LRKSLSALRFEVVFVISIDEKMKLFTKLVFDKVEKEKEKSKDDSMSNMESCWKPRKKNIKKRLSSC